MKKLVKSFLERLAGLDQTAGTPIDLTLGGPLRLKSTCEPDQKLEFNEFWQRIHREANRF